MRVQTHARRPLDPLATIEDDYEQAVLHIAWNQSEAGTRTLLFAFVELLPTELPPPLDDGEQRDELGAGHSLRLRRLVMSARESLAWYFDCRNGSFTLPDDDGVLTTVDAQGVDVVLGEEPAWPGLACPTSHHTIPFCPRDYRQPRVHHLVAGADFPLHALWPERGLADQAARWLADRLHFSLNEYSEYWGSVHLVAPNPIYRFVELRLLSTIEGDSVLARFQPRAGRALDDLELILTERESWGVLDLRRLAVESPVMRLDFGRKVTQIKEEVVDPRRGVLSAMAEELPFWTSISVREVGRPDPAGKVALVASAAERMREAQRRRENEQEARERVELLEGHDSALEALRERASPGTRDVMIVDSQLRAVAPLIDELDLHFASYRFLTAAREAESGARLDGLRQEIGALHAREDAPRIELRVQSDAFAELEGYFVVFDGQIWMANVPLHRFGQRDSLMLAAPREASLRDRLERAWSGARRLDGGEDVS